MAWTKVQSVQFDTGGTGGASNTVTYSSPLTPGSLLVAYAAIAANDTVTFSDGTNAWTTAGSKFSSTQGSVVALGWAINSSSSALTVTVTFSGSGVFRNGGIAEFTGNTSSSPVDVVSAGNAPAGGSTTITDVAMTTATSGDLIVTATSFDSGTLTAGSGFTLIGQNATSESGWEYQTQVSAGSITPTLTSSVTTLYTVISAAFKPSAGGGPTGPPEVVMAQRANTYSY